MRPSRKVFGALAALALTVGLIAAPQPTLAQTSEMRSPSIAVIDMQRIMQESTAVRSIQRQIDQKRSQYQEELSRKEQELREADEELDRQRAILSSEAFQQKRQELEQQVGVIQREVQSQRQRLDQEYTRAMREVEKVLIEIINDISESRDLDVVLNKATIVLARTELEITGPALERLNAQLESVDVQALQN
jgi:Skp family chaperone for outer membrane proteins